MIVCMYVCMYVCEVYMIKISFTSILCILYTYVCIYVYVYCVYECVYGRYVCMYACMCRLCLFLNMTCIGRAVGTACQRINTSLTTAQVDLCDTEGELKHLLKQPPDSYASKCLNYREKYVLIKIESKWHFTASVHESMPV